MMRKGADLGRASFVSLPSGRALAVVRTVLGGGALATRLVVAGVLLAVGLPALTILVYDWGYPSRPVPLPLVVLTDVLQILIVLNALAVTAQLVAWAGRRAPSIFHKQRQAKETHEAAAPLSRLPEAREAPVPLPQRPAMGLRELSLSLAVMIWERERKGQGALGPAVLDYVRDAVTAELTYRRRLHALEQRLAGLEVGLSEGSGPAVSGPHRP